MISRKQNQVDSTKIVIGEVLRIPDSHRAYVLGKDETSDLIHDENYASEHNLKFDEPFWRLAS